MKWIRERAGRYYLQVHERHLVGIDIIQIDQLWHVLLWDYDKGVYPTLAQAKAAGDEWYGTMRAAFGLPPVETLTF
jgi:hypothetical protein